MSTVLRIYAGFDGSTVGLSELGAVTLPDLSAQTGSAGQPFGGLKVAKQDVAGLLRAIADELDPENEES